MELFASAAAAFANLASGLLRLVKENRGAIAALFAFFAGKRAGVKEVAAEQAKEDAKLEHDYVENRNRDRTTGDTLKRMQTGDF